MSFDWRESRHKISMGERVGKLIPFLKQTACIHLNERELIAWLKIYALLNPQEIEFNKWLEKTAIPAFQYLGWGNWYRDTITDLALALSRGKASDKAIQDMKDVLVDYEP